MASFGNRAAVSALVILAAAMLISLTAYPVSADVEVASTISAKAVLVTSPIEIIETSNATEFKGTITWQYNETIEGELINLSGIARIHVNWDQYPSGNVSIFNVLELIDQTDRGGFFNVTLIQTSKMDHIQLNGEETSAVTAYIKQGFQSSSDPGYILQNDTKTGPFEIAPSPSLPYYIGFNYTEPPITTNNVGQYENFTFNFTLPF